MITKQFFASEDYKNCLVTEEFLGISCCFFERSRLSDIFSHAYFDTVKTKCCVYMLWNKTETNPTVYIGKASYNCVINRLRSHNREKDFWKNAVVFSSDVFGDADIEWVEATLINKARKYERCNLYNKKEEGFNDNLYENNKQQTARKVSWFVKNVLRNKLGIDIFLSLENSWQTSKPFALLSYYEMLEVGMTSSFDEIKKAYKIKSLQYHPDRNSGSADSQDKMRLINEAYEVLIDGVKRKNYDSKIVSEEMAADKAEEERRRAEQARKQQEETRRRQQEEARKQSERQNSYQQHNASYSYHNAAGATTSQDYTSPEIRNFKKYNTFFYGALSASVFLLFISFIGKDKETSLESNDKLVQMRRTDWSAFVTKYADLQQAKNNVQEKLTLLENNREQRMNEITALKNEVDYIKNQTVKLKQEAVSLKQQAENQLEDSKQKLVEAEKIKEDAKRLETAAENHFAAAIKQAEEIKQNSIAMEKQAEEKLAGITMQEKINIDFRNQALSGLKADCDKLQKNISAYDKAEGGFIDVFQNRLPSSAIDVQKSLEKAQEVQKIFGKDAELSMQIQIAKTLMDKARKRSSR